MWDYNALTAAQKRLLKKNIIVIGGTVDERTVLYIGTALFRLMEKVEGKTLAPPEITIYITSDGGDAAIGMHIFDLISLYRRRGGKVTGIVAGYGRSAAAILLQACDTRLATPHSGIQVHSVCAKSLSLGTMEDEDQLKQIRAQMQKAQRAIIEVLAKRSGKSPETVNKMLLAGSNMTAAEALEAGLVDGIAGETVPTT